MFIYDVKEELMNINEAVKVLCILMKYLKSEIAMSRKTYKIIWSGFQHSVLPCTNAH